MKTLNTSPASLRRAVRPWGRVLLSSELGLVNGNKDFDGLFCFAVATIAFTPALVCFNDSKRTSLITVWANSSNMGAQVWNCLKEFVGKDHFGHLWAGEVGKGFLIKR